MGISHVYLSGLLRHLGLVRRNKTTRLNQVARSPGDPRLWDYEGSPISRSA